MRKRVTGMAMAITMALSPMAGMLQLPETAMAQEVTVLPFTDVARSSTFYNSILKCFNEGWMTGKSATRFDPRGELTRAQFAIVLARYDDADVSGYTSCPFPDVDFSKNYAKSVAWAADMGITTGSNGLFKPNSTVTRAQFAAFLYKYLKYRDIQLIPGDEVVFDDENTISNSFKTAVHTLANAGVITGKNGCFNPNDPCTREQCAGFLLKFDKAVEKALAAQAPTEPEEPEKTEDGLTIVDSGKLARYVSLEELESTTHYANYFDMNTSEATYGNGDRVFNGYYTILDEDTLTEIAYGKKSNYTINVSNDGGNGCKYLLLDKGELTVSELLKALKKMTIVYKGSKVTGLHLQYVRGYAGMHHGVKPLFAIVGNASDSNVTMENQLDKEGSLKVRVDNPGITDTITWNRALDASGNPIDTWDNVLYSWEPTVRGSMALFQDMTIIAEGRTIKNRDAYAPQATEKYTVTLDYVGSAKNSKKTLNVGSFSFVTKFQTSFDLPKPKDYAGLMKSYFGYVDEARNVKADETNTPFFAHVNVAEYGIEIYLSDGASEYYRWKHNNLFKTTCYAETSFITEYMRDQISRPEDYAATLLALQGEYICMKSYDNLLIKGHGSLPIADDKYVYVYFHCKEKTERNKDVRIIQLTGLPSYAEANKSWVTNIRDIHMETHHGHTEWSSANVGNINSGFWSRTYADFITGNIATGCGCVEKVHKDCPGYANIVQLPSGVKWDSKTERYVYYSLPGDTK